MKVKLGKWRAIVSLVLAVCLLASATAVVSAGNTTRITAIIGQPLQCSDVRATDIGYSGATIRWETNLDASSNVYYDTISRTSIDDYRYTQEDLTPVIGHSVRLTSLHSDTRYYYRVKSTAGNATCISDEYTFMTRTPITPPSPPPPAPTLYLNVIIGGVSTNYEISNEGELMERVERTSPDGKVAIVIPEGTIVLDKNGNPLETLTISVDAVPSCPPPEGGYVILPYNFGPSGATFNPPITVTWHYDQADIPADVSEQNLTVAYCNVATGQWVPVSAVVNANTNTITATVSHFTTFALIGTTVVQYTLTVASTVYGSVTTPGEGTFTYDEGMVVNLVASATTGYRFTKWTGDVSTIANVNAATTTITMNGSYSITANFEFNLPAAGGVKWWLVGVIIGVVVVVGLVIFFMRRRKKA
jgi:LPXTG-motif cell wall-anchored protein